MLETRNKIVLTFKLVSITISYIIFQSVSFIKKIQPKYVNQNACKRDKGLSVNNSTLLPVIDLITRAN